MINGCGGEGGFKFKTILKYIKYVKFFDYKKAERLYSDIETKCCNPHDERFDNGGGIIDFIKANFIFSKDLVKLLHWTNFFGKIFIFLLAFISLNLFGIKYFNWN